MTRAGLAQPRLAVLWSVAVSRLVLATAAALSAPSLLLELAPHGGLAVGDDGGPRTGPRSWAAAAALVVLWLALELFARTDPRWRSWAGRRRRLTGEHLQPGLATVPLSFATGASAGLAAATAGHLLVGGVFVSAGSAESLAPTTAEVLAFALLTGWFLVVASPLSAGRTVCAAGAAGLAAGLASSYLSVLSSAVLTITAWPLLLLVVSLLVVLRPLDDVRRRLRSWSTGVARRWARTGRRDDTSGLRAAAPLRGAPATRR